MARSRINVITDDLISDSGSVLWSFVMGEQLEYPITLNFISDVSTYSLEAVVVEGKNVLNQEEPPTTIQVGGTQNVLTIRKPEVIGTWSDTDAYNAEDVVLYNGLYYKLLTGAGYISDTLPTSDEHWEETTLNKIYVQFPGGLCELWEVAPAVGYPVYGFFELRVTEPDNSILRKTWKPVRGMVEVLFSPTEITPDI